MPSNFGISDGNFASMGGQKAWWQMGSFVNLSKSGEFRQAMKGIFDPKLMWDGAAMGVGFVSA